MDAADVHVVDVGDEIRRSTPIERLLDRTDRLPAAAVRDVRRAYLEAIR